MIDLYYNPGSGASRLVLLTLAALNVSDVRFHAMDLKSQQPQELSQIMMLNPQHTIPTMVDDGFVLWESRAISRYLVNKYGGRDHSLYPTDPRLRGLIDARLDFDLGALCPSFAQVFYPQLYYGRHPGEPQLKKLREALSTLDTLVSAQEYAAGSNLSIADLALVATISTIDAADIDLSPYPNIIRWYQQVRNVAPNYAEANGIGVNEFRKLATDIKKLRQSQQSKTERVDPSQGPSGRQGARTSTPRGILSTTQDAKMCAVKSVTVTSAHGTPEKNSIPPDKSHSQFRNSGTLQLIRDTSKRFDAIEALGAGEKQRITQFDRQFNQDRNNKEQQTPNMKDQNGRPRKKSGKAIKQDLNALSYEPYVIRNKPANYEYKNAFDFINKRRKSSDVKGKTWSDINKENFENREVYKEEEEEEEEEEEVREDKNLSKKEKAKRLKYKGKKVDCMCGTQEDQSEMDDDIEEFSISMVQGPKINPSLHDNVAETQSDTKKNNSNKDKMYQLVNKMKLSKK